MRFLFSPLVGGSDGVEGAWEGTVGDFEPEQGPGKAEREEEQGSGEAEREVEGEGPREDRGDPKGSKTVFLRPSETPCSRSKSAFGGGMTPTVPSVSTKTC
jgi:hypothetical protein